MCGVRAIVDPKARKKYTYITAMCLHWPSDFWLIYMPCMRYLYYTSNGTHIPAHTIEELRSKKKVLIPIFFPTYFVIWFINQICNFSHLADFVLCSNVCVWQSMLCPEKDKLIETALDYFLCFFFVAVFLSFTRIFNYCWWSLYCTRNRNCEVRWTATKIECERVKP